MRRISDFSLQHEIGWWHGWIMCIHFHLISHPYLDGKGYIDTILSNWCQSSKLIVWKNIEHLKVYGEKV